jgi:Domain of unknown function (DUF1857)
MIYVSHAIPINEAGQPVLDRSAMWDGLVQKANNALPFVPAMTQCHVIARHNDLGFDRDIELRGQHMTERILLEPEHRVVFTRLAGPVLGTIANEIEEAADGELSLRFSFALCVSGVSGGSEEERGYAEGMTQDYLKAVAATLTAIRRVASGETA